MKFGCRSLLPGTTALTYAALTGAVVLMPERALAACQTVSGSDATIGSSISCITWDSNSITVTGGGMVAGVNTAVTNSGNTVGNLTNSGSIIGNDYGIITSGTIGSLTNDGGTISGISSIGIDNNGSIGSIARTGTISGEFRGIDNNSSIGSIINTGTLNGFFAGIENDGSIGVIDNGNSSSIVRSYYGIYNIGSIGIISNSGLINGGNSGISNGGRIGTLTNNGLINDNNGIENYEGRIGVIVNTGVILSDETAVFNEYRSIGSITNTGTISGTSNGIYNTSAIISIISNSGTIGNTHSCGICAAISNDVSGTIGTITNSGLIGGPVAIFSDNTSTILGAISNTGTIAGNIDVGQDLTFTGGNSSTIGTLTGYSGSIGTITATDLTFNSSAYQLLDDDVNVNSGAGAVTNSGTLMIKATHTIAGNYVQASGALLTVGVIDPTHYGDLVIAGNATMTDDHVSITPASGTLTSGESFTIVQDTITGTAAYSGIMATATGFTAAVSSITSGGFDDLIVSLSGGAGTYGPIGAAAGGGMAPAVGAALDQIKAGGNASFNSLFTALDNLGTRSEAAEQAGIKQLAPNQVTPQIAASGLLADQTAQVIGQHEEGLLAQNDAGPAGKAAGSEYESGVFWAQASGGVATRDDSADTGGYSQNFYGLTFGMDDHIGRNTTLGEAIGWMHSDAGGSGDLAGDAVSLDSVQFTGYGTRRFGPAFVDGMLGIGVNLYSEKRDVGFLDEEARASYGGTQYMGRVEGGWDFPVAPMMLTPLAGFEAARTNTNAYTESCAGAADIAVGGQGINSFAITLGGKIATTLPTAWGDFVPEIKAAWIHDLTGGAITTPASLGGVSFSTATPRAAQDGAQVTLAATFKQDDNVALRAEYDGDLRSDYSSHSGLVKVEWGF